MVAVIGKKLGMSRIFQDNGTVIPVTLIEIYNSVISDIKQYDDKDYNHLTLSFGRDKKTDKKLNKSVVGYYKKNNLEPKNDMQTFKFDTDRIFSIGEVLGLSELKIGDIINITGTSKGKGFAGVIKKYGYGGQEASHGVSLTHRHLGSTGSRRREGKVAKGKKMPGQLGNKQVTTKNLEVIKLLPENNVVCIKGAVPGSKGGKVIINTSN